MKPKARIDVKYIPMFVLITFILILLSISAIVTLRLTRLGSSYTWLIAVGVLLTWASVLLWQFDLPWHFTPGQWMPAGLFDASPQLFADSFAWLYALALTGLAAAVILTSPARSGQVGTSSWAETLALTGLGLLAVLANNPLGLALAWTAIDLAGFVAVIRKQAVLDERTWLSFAVRLVATGLALWAGVLGFSTNHQSFALDLTPPQASLFLIMSATLRVVAFRDQPEQDPALHGFETVLQSVASSAGLVLLARIPVAAMDRDWVLGMLVVTALAAIYNGWKWLFAPDALTGRPYWLLGVSGLSLAACLGGNPAGSAAWGVSLVLFGGLSFLYTAKHVWLTRIFALATLFILSLPFTLTASGWLGTFPLPFVFLPLLVLAHALFVAGYVRHILRSNETEFAQLPNWSQTSYAFGMGMLLLTMLLASVWGWQGSLEAGRWEVGLAVLPLVSVVLFVSYRFRLPSITLPRLLPVRRNRPLRLPSLLNLLIRAFSFFYRLVGSLTIYISDLLEGDGGLLWTLLLLILLISFLRGH